MRCIQGHQRETNVMQKTDKTTRSEIHLSHRNLLQRHNKLLRKQHHTLIQSNDDEVSTWMLCIYFIILIVIAALCSLLLIQFPIFACYDSKAKIDVVNSLANGFLALNSSTLSLYDFNTGTFSVISKRFTPTLIVTFATQIAKMNHLIYQFDDKSSLKINCYSDLSATWKYLDWDNKYEGRKYIPIKGHIAAVGAFDHRYKFPDAIHASGSSAVDLYNAATGEWSALPSMNEPRAHHSLVVFQGRICAIGGDKSKTLECFDLGTNKTWAYLPAMPTRRREAAAVEMDGELYVIGGEHGNTFEQLHSVEKYNPATKTWNKVADLKQGMTGHAAGVYNGKILVIGGVVMYMACSVHRGHVTAL